MVLSTNNKKDYKNFLPFLGVLVVIFVFHFTDWFILKYYPVCINFAIFCIFFTSIFQKETVIQRFALSEIEKNNPKILNYTRKLTYIWAIVTFINFLISFYTVFLPEKIWALYNGFISYLFVGLNFGIEYIIRINFKRKNGC